MSDLYSFKNLITKMIEVERLTYKEVSSELEYSFNVKGASERSVRRFCNENNISKNFKCSFDQLKSIVKDAAPEVRCKSIRNKLTQQSWDLGLCVDKEVHVTAPVT